MTELPQPCIAFEPLQAIRRDDSDKSFYSNRAAALSAMNNPQGFLQALEDGRKCVELDAAWSRVRVTRVGVCVSLCLACARERCGMDTAFV